MFEAVILGIVQGITEFFPVSSTAHLILLPWVFGWHGHLDTLTFDVAVHAGTLLSLIVCLFSDWMDIIKNNPRILGLIALATVPAGTGGIFFGNFIENSLRNPLIIALMLVVFGFVMLFSERFGRDKDINTLRVFDSLAIGIAQALALVPGVSRSGITISAGLMGGLRRDAAARFSFLLSTPAVFGASLIEGKKLLLAPAQYDFKVFLAGFFASFISGVFAIKYLLRFLRKHPMNVFVYYRFFLASLIAGLIWLRS